MKKAALSTILFSVLTLNCITAAAQGPVGEPVMPPVRINSANDFVPSDFSVDGKPLLSFLSYNKDGVATVQIVDASINTLADFSVDPDPDLTSIFKIGKLWQNMYWSSVERNIVEVDDYIDNVESFLAEKFGVKYYKVIAKYCMEDGSSDGVVYGSEESFQILPNGDKVIKEFVYQTGNKWVFVKCSGDCRVEKKFDVSREEISYLPSVMTLQLANYDVGTVALGSVAVTQTLFNEDSDFEYITPLYKTVERNEEQLFYDYLYDFGYFAFIGFENIESRQPDYCYGFSIINDKGTALQTVNFDAGFRANSQNFMSIIIIGGKTYLKCNLISDDKSSYTILYEVNRSQMGVKKVGMFKTGVYPTVVSRDENVTVDFGDAAEESLSISVNDISGRRLYYNVVRSEERSVMIPSSKMSDGLNIVTVNGEKSGISSTKVLVNAHR